MAKKRMEKGAASKRPTLAEISKKLDVILKEQERIRKEEGRIEELGRGEIAEEEAVEKEEEKEISELEKLKRLEAEVKKEVVPHPLKTITYKDIARGSIGALFGSVAHYTFLYSIEVAEKITFFKAILLFILSLIIGALFLYATGFRKIKDPKVIIFLPLRLFVLYTVSIIMSIIVLWFFEPTFGQTFEQGFMQVSTTTLLAIIGACTADLLGRD
jgi:uncharacterized membrane protein